VMARLRRGIVIWVLLGAAHLSPAVLPSGVPGS
jgi:hypothetical protein